MREQSFIRSEPKGGFANTVFFIPSKYNIEVWAMDAILWQWQSVIPVKPDC